MIYLKKTICEECMYYEFDEDSETYSCIINLDEDEAQRFMSGDSKRCSYFRFYDEYKMVKKQN